MGQLAGERNVSYLYSIINDTESFTIAPLPVTVTWDNISFIYNGTAQKPVASYYNVEGVAIPLTVEGEKTDVSASDYTATAVCSDTNYELINPTESFNILPLTVEVIWGNREFIFNGANQKPEAEYIDVNGERIALSVSGEEINASETAYVAVASASDANYSIINTSASFTISALTTINSATEFICPLARTLKSCSKPRRGSYFRLLC